MASLAPPTLLINWAFPVTPPPFATLSPKEKSHRWQTLAGLFLRLGLIAFGGPAAHVAMMENEVVQRRGWVSREKFLDLLGVTNLIPGPNSTELAIHLGYEWGGAAGLIIAGVCFILPAMAVVWLLAIAYERYQALPVVVDLLYGIKPMLIPLIGQALWKLGQKAWKGPLTGGVAIAVMGGVWAGQSEIGLLLAAGLGLMAIKSRQTPPTALMVVPAPIISPSLSDPVTLGGVFAVFLKIGSVLYGGGYVLFAFLQADLVDRLGWLTSQQVLDAIAIGQITPGPLFTSATFVGYLLAGHGGAIAATVGIFLLSFVFVALVNPWVDRLRQSQTFRGFLDGVNAGAWGLMAVTTLSLAQSALVDPLTLALGLGGAIALARFNLPSQGLVLIGALVGLGKLWLG